MPQLLPVSPPTTASKVPAKAPTGPARDADSKSFSDALGSATAAKPKPAEQAKPAPRGAQKKAGRSPKSSPKTRQAPQSTQKPKSAKVPAPVKENSTESPPKRQNALQETVKKEPVAAHLQTQELPARPAVTSPAATTSAPSAEQVQQLQPSEAASAASSPEATENIQVSPQATADESTAIASQPKRNAGPSTFRSARASTEELGADDSAEKSSASEDTKTARAPSEPADARADDDQPAATAAAPIVALQNAADPALANSPRADVPPLTHQTTTVAAEPRTPHVQAPQSPATLQRSAEAQFIDANHPRLVTGVHGQLLPNGGSMHLRLDPPDLGSLHVRVEMRDGVMTASFETSSDQATRLLSHSLGDLKTVLEAQGVSVDKLHVRQSPREQSSSGDDPRGEADRQQEQAARQEQQRKEILRRMWQRVSNGQDPLDLVA